MPVPHTPPEICPVYTVDARNRLATVNAAWLKFMQPRAGRAWTSEQVLGRSIWDLTPGGQVRQLWEILYARVRALGGPVFVPMRADTADERRLIDIELRPLAEHAIQHVCERVWSEPRPAAALLDTAYPRDGRLLRHCGWCCRIEVANGVWEEVEDAQRLLAIEAGMTLPALLPVACTGCRQSLLETFPARGLGRAVDAG